ncbi:unnamed protein product [Microthlaspi erraticum]|uniref:TF-B3 domain-containing protein n=1 Tax=Microthlaspi erraticum TaxID=1685480 RepID=A0A6D2IK85_9BRAS|nr:unnamed protein product [Microthlaspi erraticum]
MEQNCEDCMRWEEELYWTHFQTLHFAQLLLAGFQNRLAIPQKFSTHCKRKLPETVTLKSPSGASYTVKVEEDDEKTLSFCLGWEKFVKDHSLKENDLLIFKLHGVSEFEVMILDGYTLCEKPSSYFVRKCECGHAEKRKGTDFSATSTGSPQIHQQPSLPLPTYGNEVDDFFDIDTLLNPNLVVSETGYEQDAHINSEIDTTTSSQLPVIPSTITGQKISEGVYPLNVFKKMRRETSNNNLDTKAGIYDESIDLFSFHLIYDAL